MNLIAKYLSLVASDGIVITSAVYAPEHSSNPEVAVPVLGAMALGITYLIGREFVKDIKHYKKY